MRGCVGVEVGGVCARRCAVGIGVWVVVEHAVRLSPARVSRASLASRALLWSSDLEVVVSTMVVRSTVRSLPRLSDPVSRCTAAGVGICYVNRFGLLPFNFGVDFVMVLHGQWVIMGSVASVLFFQLSVFVYRFSFQAS